ncbi:diguanylate cyclase domain-containing protein [Mycobacterium sp. NPDC003449]
MRNLSPFDNYYSRTALLAARSQRTLMRRTISISIVATSALPLILIGTPAGPDGAMRFVAVAGTVCGLVLAWWWGRRRWPSRNQSWIVVTVGTLCIAVTCLTLSNPVVGLLGTATLSLITTYAAFLHSWRVLILTWVACGLAVAYLGVRVAIDDPSLGIAGTLMAALVIGGTSALCRMAVTLIDPDNMQHPGEIDPLTGLLNRSAFGMHTATMMGSHSRHDDQYLVVVAVGIDDMALLSHMDGTYSTFHARITVGQALRETVRRRVPLAHVSDTEFLIADVFKTDDPSPLVERIRIAIGTTPMRLTASIGTACSPLRPLTEFPAEQVVDALIDLATRSMNQSRAAGGNQTTYAHYPTPTMDSDGPE